MVDYPTWASVPDERWKELADRLFSSMEDDDSIKDKKWITNWIHPDLAHGNYSGQVRRQWIQPAMPGKIGGVPVAGTSRSGDTFCVSYQQDKCTASTHWHDRWEVCRFGRCEA